MSICIARFRETVTPLMLLIDADISVDLSLVAVCGLRDMSNVFRKFSTNFWVTKSVSI